MPEPFVSVIINIVLYDYSNLSGRTMKTQSWFTGRFIFLTFIGMLRGGGFLLLFFILCYFLHILGTNTQLNLYMTQIFLHIL